MGLFIVRFDFQDFGKTPDGMVKSLLLHQGLAQFIMQFRIGWVNSGGPFVMMNSLLRSVQMKQQIPHILMQRCIVRSDL